MDSPQPENELDLAAELGANSGTSIQQLTLYIPDTDRHGKPIKKPKAWVKRAVSILVKMGGGYTIAPPAEGGWLADTGEIIVDKPTILYSYINEGFTQHLPELRRFLHDLGRETDQGEVAFEFDGVFYRISKYDRSLK